MMEIYLRLAELKSTALYSDLVAVTNLEMGSDKLIKSVHLMDGNFYWVITMEVLTLSGVG